MTQYSGELAAILTSFLWAFGSIAFSKASTLLSPIRINIDRLIIASIFLGAYLLFFTNNITQNTEQFTYLALSGFIGLVVGDSFLFTALRDIGPRYTLLIMSINPAFAAIISYLAIGETLAYSSIMAMGICAAGIALVVLGRNKNSFFKITKKGFIFALFAAVGQATGLVLAKLASEIGHIGEIEATFSRLGFATISLLIILIITKKWVNPIPIYKGNRLALLLVIAGSFLGPIIGVTLSYYAVANAETGIAATLLSLSPVMMIPLSYFVFKDKGTRPEIIGTILAFVGVLLLF